MDDQLLLMAERRALPPRLLRSSLHVMRRALLTAEKSYHGGDCAVAAGRAADQSRPRATKSDQNDRERPGATHSDVFLETGAQLL